MLIVILLLLICAVVPPLRGQSAPQVDSGVNRAAVLQKYDKDKDGHLSDGERESMRKEVFAQRRRGSGGRNRMMFPPEIVEKYDKNADGSLDDEEGSAAREGITKMFQDLQRKYDTNGNGDFEPAEAEKMRADAAAGKLEGVPRFFLQMVGGRRGPRFGAGPSSRQMDLRQVDKDGDGRLSEEELRAARAARQNAPETSGATKP